MNRNDERIAYIGANLKSLRGARGLSTYELAEKSGVSRLTITGLETGKTDDVKMRTLLRLGDALGIHGWMLCVRPEPLRAA